MSMANEPWQIQRCGDDWDWYVLLDANYRHLSDASVEGTAEEWRAVADALTTGESVSFKRLSAKKDGNDYLFCSPRNTQGRSARLCGHEQAAKLAEAIYRVLDATETP